jgi:hypothetical protein
MSLSVLLFGVQESTVRSKFIIYIYIWVRRHLEMWQQCWVASLEAKSRWVVSCNHPISCILQCRSGTELAMTPRKIMIMISRSILPAQVPGYTELWVRWFASVVSLVTESSTLSTGAAGNAGRGMNQPLFTCCILGIYCISLCNPLFHTYLCVYPFIILLSIMRIYHFIIIYHCLSWSIIIHLSLPLSIYQYQFPMCHYLCLSMPMYLYHCCWLTMIIYYWSSLPIIKYHVYHVLAVSIISLPIIIYYPSLPSLS